jgi:hypothetical protein
MTHGSGMNDNHAMPRIPQEWKKISRSARGNLGYQNGLIGRNREELQVAWLLGSGL